MIGDPGDLVGAFVAALLTSLAAYVGLELGARELQRSWLALVPLVLVPFMSCAVVYWLARTWS